MPLLPVDTGRLITVATFFRVTALIGVGRYAEVYAAFDTQSQSDVALKLYTGSDAETHAVALNEADVLGKLGALNSEYFPHLRYAVKHRLNNRSHPVLALELGGYHRQDGTRDVVRLLDVIPDGSADAHAGRIDGEFWEARTAVQWIIHLCQAVKLLHDAGIIHRDIKPSNIVIKRAANKTEALPMLLDFNSSPNGGPSQKGTPRYLPPESSQRSKASADDDVWATALVAWEMLHGAGSNPADASPIGPWIKGAVPSGVVAALCDALLLDVERRTRTAEGLVGRIEDALRTPQVQNHALPIGVGEFADVLAAQAGVRLVIEEALSPPHLLVVPKDVEDSVHSLLLWLNETETQALDLVGELVRLGPRAIPACLNQGHKLSPNSAATAQLVKALTQLGLSDRALAVRSIELYSTSSNVTVRLLCRRLCGSLEVFPVTLLNALHDNIEVLLPEERLDLARLCLLYSSSEKAGGTVLKFACREYIADPSRYSALRTLAGAMGKWTHPRRAEVAEWYAHSEKWKDLPEYRAVPQADQQQMDRGVLEVISDAFASMGDAAFELVRSDRLHRRTSGDPALPLFSKFVRKLAKRHEPTKRWLLDQVKRHPDDRDLAKAAEDTEQLTPDEVEPCFKTYLESDDRVAFNALRFCDDPRVFALVRESLEHKPSEQNVKRIAALLEGCENRQRGRVVECVIRCWSLFERHDVVRAIRILSKYSIRDARLREEAVATLSTLLSGPLAEPARKGIDRLLA